MLLEIKDMKLSINDAIGQSDLELARQLAAKRLKLSEKDIEYTKLLRKSIDARKKDSISFVYTVKVKLKDDSKAIRLVNQKDISAFEEEEKPAIACGSKSINNRPIIIGSGPAGLFAGLVLAENGYKPLILERGKDVDGRTRDIEVLFQKGIFLDDSNIQFGEGGAGTFSDGKLTTRIKDSRCDFVLERLISAGAPGEIAYSNKPHVGTDILKTVIKNIRERIIQLGGDVRFSSKVTDIIIENDSAKAVIINSSERMDSNIIIAALGHSARDTYRMLFDRGVKLVQKPFSIGVRIEHPQTLINTAQYGRFAGHPTLGAADYTLTYRSQVTGRSVYSFCMCPGGTVVAAASERGMLVTNGMSEYRRDKENANSAIVVSVSPEDFGSLHPLAGIEFQRIWEGRAYNLGGMDFTAPVQLVGDFQQGSSSVRLGSIKPSYMPGVKPGDLRQCLPGFVTDSISEALVDFDRKIKGFAQRDAVMTGVETRTSAPLRIVRKETMECENIDNLYPIGEGAGYAGGIISAAVDGIKAAEKIISRFKPMI